MRKNQAGQKLRVFAFNRETGEPVLADAANITCKVSKDYGTRTALTDTNPAETEDGYYLFDLTQAETNADVLEWYPESSTSGVQVVPALGTDTVAESLAVFTVPDNGPLSLNEVKEYLRVESDYEDATITAFLLAATGVVEHEIQRPLVMQRFKEYADEFPNSCGDYTPPYLSDLEHNAFFLPKTPLRQVNSIKFVATDGTAATLASSEYQVDRSNPVGRIMPAWGKSWPATRYVAAAVTVDYSAGYLIPASVDVDADEITTSGYSPTDGDIVRFSASGGSLPEPLEAATDYFVVNADGETFQVSTEEGGDPVDLTSEGSGLLFVGELPACVTQALKLLVHNYYWHRDEAKDVMPTVKRLLDPVRWSI